MVIRGGITWAGGWLEPSTATVDKMRDQYVCEYLNVFVKPLIDL